MTLLGIVTIGAALVAWGIYQLRVSFDANEARQHEQAMLRLQSDVAQTAEITSAAALVAKKDLTLAETRLAELKAVTAWKADERALEAYARRYLDHTPFTAPAAAK